MVSELRAQRIADRIREEFSEMLIHDVQDERILGVSVTDVQVDRELAFADVYVSAVEGSVRAKEILEGLIHARGFFRSQLSNRIDLRVFPRLRFHWDPTIERAENIDRLIAALHQGDPVEENEPPPDESLAEGDADD